MNFFNRARINAGRNLGKTFILFLMIFVLSCVISGAISVRQAVYNTGNNIRANLPAVVSVEIDWDGISERAALADTFPEGEVLTYEMLDEIASLPYVRNSDVVAISTLMSTELENVLPDGCPRILYDLGDIWTGLDSKGVRSPSFVDIDEGLIKLYSGRNFSEEDLSTPSYVTLVSRSLAELNGLGIGSTISLEAIVWDDSGLVIGDRENYVEENIFARRGYEFEIIGIFEPSSEIDTGLECMDMDVLERIENRIYIPNSIAVDALLFYLEQFDKVNEGWMQDEPEAYMYHEGIFVLNDPLELEDFKAAVLTIVPVQYGVMTTNSDFDNVNGAMMTVKSLATGSLLFAIVATVLILNFLIFLILRDRKREIGIYLALGEHKAKIIAQVTLEVIFITVVAVTLSLFVGNIFASALSESMLRADLIASQMEDLQQARIFSTLDNMGFSTGESASEMLARYDASLDAHTVLLFYATSLATVMMATIIPMFYVTRLDPKKILM